MVVAAGRYRPGTVTFEALLAHEMAHTRQQSGATDGVSRSGEPGIGSGELEDEADRAAYHAALILLAPAVAAGAAPPSVRTGRSVGLQLFLCAPPEPGETISELPTREQYEATGELAPRALDDALLQAGGLDWGHPGGGLTVEGVESAATPAGTALGRRGERISEDYASGAATLSLDAARARLIALEEAHQQADHLVRDIHRPLGIVISPAFIAYGLAAADWETGGPAPGSADRAAGNVTDVPPTPTALSREIVRSERLVALTIAALTDLARVRVAEEQTGERSPGYDGALAVSSVDDVRWAYARTLDVVLTPRAVTLFNRAVEAHDGLARTLTELKIARFTELGSEHEEIAPAVDRMQSWAWRLYEQIAELEVAVPALEEARDSKDPGLAAMQRQFVRRAQLIMVSIEALGEWDMAVQAYGFLRSGSALVGYEGVDDIAHRLGQMDDAARDGDLPYLQLLLRDHRADPAVAEYFGSLPEIVEWSQLAIGLAITLLAIAVAAPIGIMAGGAVTGLLVGAGFAEGSALVLSAGFVAHVGAEAVVFTLVSRGLSSLAPGMEPTGPLWADLLWNFGLFGALKGLGLGARAAILAGESRALVTATQLAGTYMTLQGYGYVRFAVEKGRPMTDAELGRMSLHNLVMLAALTVATRPLQEPLARLQQSMALRTLRARYSRRFAEISSERATLEKDVAERSKENPQAGPEDVADLEARARDIDTRLKELVDEVAADSEVADGLRPQLTRLLLEAAERPLPELLLEAGLEPVVDLQPTGNDMVWTFRPDTAPMLLRFLRSAGIEHSARTVTGTWMVDAAIPGRGQVQLVEREARVEPTPEPGGPGAAPPTAESKLTDATLQKRVGNPANPKDMAAHYELQRRYRRKTIRQLVGHLRRNTRWATPYAREALADGWGRRGTMAEYLSEDSLDMLRDIARYDPVAAEALVERYYRDLSPVQLENRIAEGDNTARYVLENPREGPAMEASAEARLVERIWEQRRTESEAAGREAAEEEAAGEAERAAETRRRSDQALESGTVGAMETDIPGLTDPVVRGSPRAPTAIDPNAPRPLRPATEVRLAQLHAEEQLLNWLIGRLEALDLEPTSLEGRHVRIVVDQRVCSYCSSGLATGEHAGVLVQFGRLYPGVEVQIVDLRSGDYLVLQGGRRTLHHRRAGTLEE